MNNEIRGIHFEHLAVGLFVNDLVAAIKGSRITGRQEEVQVLGCCGGEIDKSKKETLLAWGST